MSSDIDGYNFFLIYARIFAFLCFLHIMDNTNANKGCNKAVGAAIAVAAILFLTLAFASCNVTRTITTSAQTIQRGDTTTIIQTKTIETYDGSVEASKFLKK